MKRCLFLLFLGIILTSVSYSQQSFKYVIIPTVFPDIGKGFNPHNVCSSLQKTLHEKGIESIFEPQDRLDDYCDALMVELDKSSTFLSTKMEVRLKDCSNRIVWSGIGTSRLKKFVEIYAEAIDNALSDLEKLPANTLVLNYIPASEASQPSVQSTETSSAQVSAETSLQNVYFNEKYIVNLVNETEKTKKLVIVNGELTGYEKLQEVATLTSIDMPELYIVEWTMPEGNKLKGVAELNDSKLKITLSSGNEAIVINLIKK